MTRKLHNPKAYAPSVYIPCWLIQVASNLLSHQGKLLYGRLAQWASESGKVYRSVPQLAEELGCSKSTIDRTIKELKDCGLIGTFQPKKGGISHFEFYDHEWMYQPIKEQLSYKMTSLDVTSDVTLPHVRCDVTPTSDLTSINIKEIEINNINKKGTSCEVSKITYTDFDQQSIKNKKSDYPSYQAQSTKNKSQLLESEIDLTKSDYFESQTKNKTLSKFNRTYGLKNLQEDNIFNIPEQLLEDWITNRKKKRAPVTKTAWSKINKELGKCKALGIEPIDAFEKMVAHGWQALDAEWFCKEKKGDAGTKWDVDAVMRA